MKVRDCQATAIRPTYIYGPRIITSWKAVLNLCAIALPIFLVRLTYYLKQYVKRFSLCDVVFIPPRHRDRLNLSGERYALLMVCLVPVSSWQAS